MSERFFRVFTGLLTSDHKKRIGSSLWTFLWLIDRITDETVDEETGQRTGLVLYGNITSYSTIGNDLGMSKSTVKEQCEKLQSEGYISMEQTPRGNKFHVNRSKKWNDPSKVRAENRTNRAENNTNRAENRTTEFPDRAENRTEGAENRTIRSETPPSNTNIDTYKEKKITTTNTDDDFVFGVLNDDDHDESDQLVSFFLQKAGRLMPRPNDYVVAKEILATVSLDDACKFVDAAINLYRKRKGTDIEINSMAYIHPVMKQMYELHQARNNVIQLPKREAVFINQDSDAFKLSMMLYNLIKEKQQDFTEPDLNQWAFEFNQMIESGKKFESIEKTIHHARSTDFWLDKILSPSRLNKNYDTLRAQALRTKNGNSNRRNQRVADMPKWAKEESITRNDAPSTDSANKDDQEELNALLAERQRRKEEKEQKHGS